MELAGTADAAVYLHPAESGAGLREIKALGASAHAWNLRLCLFLRHNTLHDAASGQLKFKISVEGKVNVASPSQLGWRHCWFFAGLTSCPAPAFCAPSAGTRHDRAGTRCLR